MVKKSALAIGLVVAAAGYAAATGGSIVSSFRSPHAATTPRGMAYAPNHSRLYHVSSGSPYIFATDTSGSIVKSFLCPANTRGVEGLGESQGHGFWTCSFSPAVAYRVSTTGSIMSSFAALSRPNGLTREGDYIWLSSETSNVIYKHRTTGSLVASFASPAGVSSGLDWDGNYLWLADANTGSKIYQLTTTGSVRRALKVPVGRAAGVAFDGTHVWYCSLTSPKYVYRITIGKIAVEPASLGRVKALFR